MSRDTPSGPPVLNITAAEMREKAAFHRSHNVDQEVAEARERIDKAATGGFNECLVFCSDAEAVRKAIALAGFSVTLTEKGTFGKRHTLTVTW